MQNTLVHVAVGVIFNHKQEVLVALRSQHRHQGNLWEFPGGKLEGNETTEQALRRELWEEVGIQVLVAQPLMTTHHQYDDKTVYLDVWEVSQFAGQAYGREGQPIQWLLPEQLLQLAVPAANRAVVEAVIKRSQQTTR